MPLSPEEKAEWNAAADQANHIVNMEAKNLLHFAMGCVEHGAGMLQMAALRSKEQPQLAGFVIVATGPYTDSDLANVKNLVMGSMQDAAAGWARPEMIRDVDNLKREGGA